MIVIIVSTAQYQNSDCRYKKVISQTKITEHYGKEKEFGSKTLGN